MVKTTDIHGHKSKPCRRFFEKISLRVDAGGLFFDLTNYFAAVGLVIFLVGFSITENVTNLLRQ